MTSLAASKAKRRVPLWDNARWIAITLMVVGHGILKLISESDAAYSTYLFIYAFHVGVFVTVSGYFAKSGTPNGRQMKRVVTDILLPYLIFETIWTVIRWVSGGEFWLDYSSASWTLWFLLALAAWRIVLPYLVLLRWPLLIAIAISIGAGYFANIDSLFALSRTLGFLPFFVFGWSLRQWQVTGRWLSMGPAAIWRWRAAAIALFAALAVAVALGIDTWRGIKIRRFLLYDESYASIGYSEWWAGGIRLAVMLLAFGLVLAFLMLMPRRTTWFTGLGAATMYIYLLHTFLLYPIREGGILAGPQPWWVLPAVIAFCIAVSIVLSMPFIRKVFRPLVEPRADWLFRREDSTATGTIVLPKDAPR
ncbi:fucose 4-O-acetylase-like acetyltransferase [Microterricola gilva]|uniref:Fucose 4-O-acetylase-like acetyltransferase n=1 Tax=Microterricola gilva TaxID=393267 RepID=A0A4V2GAI7_9MICO|nr:acyltransferase family protein [Microterricola gilva]RZU64426.1 fucose 4-O-acetylase-like acetyltransferase [Microterricola gilva]